MKPVKNDKDFILLCPGPEYLFWAVGFYFAWELSRSYRVILVADNPFRDVGRIERLIASGVLHDFIPFPPLKASFLGIGRATLRHRHFRRLADELFARYRVAAVIQHTDLEIANIYLFRKALAAGSLRLVFRPSTVPKDYFADYVLMKTSIINRLQDELGLGHGLASALFHLRRVFSHYFNYRLVPLILTGSIFRPRINPVFRKDRFFNDNPGYFDFTLTYSEREKRITERNGEPSSVVRNPIYACGDEANRVLFEGVSQTNRILILPTSGEIEHWIGSNAGAPGDQVADYASRWAEAIKIIQGTFPGFETGIKYHPLGADDALFARVMDLLTSGNDRIKVIDSREAAEKLILESAVIVGTMTSALWWASELPSEKVVISLDLWNVPGGDRYSDMDGIHYVRDLAELHNANLTARSSSAAHKTQLPTLTAFLMRHSL